MEDMLDIRYKGCVCTVIQKEIAYKGKAYFILKEVRPESCREMIEYAAEHLTAMGAEKIYFTCSDKRAVFSEEILRTENLEFRYDGDMDYLEKEISPKDGLCESEDLLFEGLSRANGRQFLCTYNDCFFEVPNSATYTDSDLDRLIEDPIHSWAGVIMQGDQVIGIYEISFENEIPEIASIGLIKDKRGRRLGWKALHTLIGFLSDSGYRRVGLKVSTRNPNAYRLYLQTGFCKIKTLSRWYLQTR